MSKMLKRMVKNSDHALFVGLHLLSYKKRHALYSVYAYGHHINDIVSSSRTQSEKIALLKAWQNEIECIFADKNTIPNSEVGRAIKRNLQPYALLKSDFSAFLDNKLHYLTTPQANFDWNDYQKYCYDECGAFISSALRILGCRDTALIDNLSRNLGLAMQTTIVLRDIKDNAFSGNLYMPHSFLEDAGIKEFNPYMVLADNNLAKVRCRLSQVASDAFNQSFTLMMQLNKKVSSRLKSMTYVYKYYFDAMEKRGWEVLSPKPQVSCLTKLRLVCKAYLEK